MSAENEIRFHSHYRNMVQAIYKYIVIRCNDAALAEDITHDVFMQLWKKIETLDDKGIPSYLYMCAKNAIINNHKKSQVRLNYLDKQVQTSITSTPQDRLEEKELSIKIEEAIANLSDKQREVFLLNRVEGMKYREIAELLDISQKAVEKRMHLALMQLKKKLIPEVG